ncbi:MAG TPA: DUF2442 domain-containing protein [bacterium]|nr:DUF2442 domain-containing protein [bacterium]
MLEVIESKPNPDFTIILTFDNNERRVFDLKPYLVIGVFKQLQKPECFITVKPFFGGIAWDTGQDLSPETLYIESKPLT